MHFYKLFIKSKNKIKSTNNEITEEAAWKQIEKRLQIIILRVIQTESYKTFLQDIEKYLIQYIVYSYDIDNNCDTILSNTMREFIESEIFINETGLYLQLIDSSFHRLLIHAACQFHNSKS